MMFVSGGFPAHALISLVQLNFRSRYVHAQECEKVQLGFIIKKKKAMIFHRGKKKKKRLSGQYQHFNEEKKNLQKINLENLGLTLLLLLLFCKEKKRITLEYVSESNNYGNVGVGESAG